MQNFLFERLQTLNPITLNIIDESSKHHGHQPDLAPDGTHFKITIVAQCFNGKSRVERHKIIYTILEEAFSKNLHALSIKALTPEEANS